MRYGAKLAARSGTSAPCGPVFRGLAVGSEAGGPGNITPPLRRYVPLVTSAAIGAFALATLGAASEQEKLAALTQPAPGAGRLQ